MMRIITGKARGIQLRTLEGNETRPTAERVKEAVFSMLQFDIEGREVLDLFSGSGQLGLEAISRGAKHAVMVDKSRAAVEIIETNAAKTKLGSACTIKRSDCFDYIRQNKGRKFDIVFIDPPYSSGLYKPVLRALCEFDMLKDSSLIVCESDFDELIGDDAILNNNFSIKKSSKYSKTVITILEKKSTKKESVAIVPGSFDPITYGHINIVKRALEEYDKVYLAVMINREKKYMFSIDEREEIAKAALKDIDRVEVIKSEGMLWELAKSLSADAIVKGYRNDIDLEYEQKMAEYNRNYYPNAKTVLLKSTDDLADISSTVVRERLQNNESIGELLPKSAVDVINKIIDR